MPFQSPFGVGHHEVPGAVFVNVFAFRKKSRREYACRTRYVLVASGRYKIEVTVVVCVGVIKVLANHLGAAAPDVVQDVFLINFQTAYHECVVECTIDLADLLVFVFFAKTGEKRFLRGVMDMSPRVLRYLFREDRGVKGLLCRDRLSSLGWQRGGLRRRFLLGWFLFDEKASNGV